MSRDSLHHVRQDYGATMWMMMYCFGYESLPDELNGYEVRHLEKILITCNTTPKIHQSPI